MQRFFRSTFVALGFLLFSLLWITNTTPVYADPQLLTAPDPPFQGDKLSITVAGCAANSTVQLYYFSPGSSSRNAMNSGRAADNGSYSYAGFTVSQSGNYVIQVDCGGISAVKTVDVKPGARAIPAKPQGLSISPVTDTTANMIWNSQSDATYFQVWYRRTTVVPFQTNTPIMAGTANGPTFKITGLASSTNYNAWVNACNGNGCSSPSDSETFQTEATPGPGNPRVSNPPGGGTSESLNALKTIIGTNPQTVKFKNLGGLVSAILNLVFILAGLLMFVWAFIGIFQYIMAGGSKEGLAKARARITWAIVGFIFVMISFLLSGYVQQLFQPKSITIP